MTMGHSWYSFAAHITELLQFPIPRDAVSLNSAKHNFETVLT